MLGLDGASHAEYGVPQEEALITPAVCDVPPSEDGPRHGPQRVLLRRGTMAQRLYASDEAFEEFRCSNELNARYQPLFEESALRVSGVGERGEARIVELEAATFFIATLFLPQLTAVDDRPHPIINGFIRASARISQGAG